MGVIHYRIKALPATDKLGAAADPRYFFDSRRDCFGRYADCFGETRGGQNVVNIKFTRQLGRKMFTCPVELNTAVALF